MSPDYGSGDSPPRDASGPPQRGSSSGGHPAQPRVDPGGDTPQAQFSDLFGSRRASSKQLVLGPRRYVYNNDSLGLKWIPPGHWADDGGQLKDAGIGRNTPERILGILCRGTTSRPHRTART